MKIMYKSEIIENIKINNRGSAVVEATLLLPVFIFAVSAVYQMGQCKIAESALYEAAAETAEYIAEYSYIGQPNLIIPELKFSQYVDDNERIEKYIEGGVKGVNFLGSTMLDDDNYIILKVNYKVSISLPFIPELSKNRSITIKQKAYVGDDGSQGENSGSREQYVYVTDNRDVYHSTRACSHLRLSVSISDMDIALAEGYSKCGFCGGRPETRVYITDYGNKYHLSINCSGLKRTIYRVKLSELGGMRGCSRCVD